MKRVAVVVKGYPRLSETFIAQEIRELEKRGLGQMIISLRHPTDPHCHDIHDEIEAPVLYLPEYLKDDPKRVAAGRKWAMQRSTFRAARDAFERDLARDKTANRYRRWGQACVLARELADDIEHLHSHFLHTPASVTRYAAMLRGISWSFSAHAKDIWTSPDWELTEKIDHAAWGVTCTKVNRDHLNRLAAAPGKVELVYHGLDLTRFPAREAINARRDGGAGGPVRILSVGRAVEKKGYDDLLRALARLPDDLDWHFNHIGGGALRDELGGLADRLGIAGQISWLGAQPRSAVIEACAASDLFVLASRITKSGDRDGMPNVLLEAQLMGVACVSTAVSAIPELIDDGHNGLLVRQRDFGALAEAIETLARDPTKREIFARNGMTRVRSDFSTMPGIDRLVEKFAS